MRLLALEAVEPGMHVGRNIRLPDDTLLLLRGMALRNEHIASLRRLQVPSVYVWEGSGQYVDIPEEICQEIRTEFQRALDRLIIPANTPADIQKVRDAIDAVITEFSRNKAALLTFLEARAVEPELMAQSAAVAVMSILMGFDAGLSLQQLHELGIGAMLHDAGKARVPPAILYRQGVLMDGEVQLFRSHTTLGFQILRKVDGVPLLSAHVAFQHHERLDGSGYPRGLRRGEIHPYATICAVAEVFYTMTMVRPNRQAVHPAVALFWIRSKNGELFSEDVVRALGHVAVPYPVGTLVRLKTGEVCEVDRIAPAAPGRPRVRLVRDRAGNPAAVETFLDLGTRKDLEIEAPVDLVQQAPSAS